MTQVINVERLGISAYVTCGRDGTIRFWHKGTFAHLRSINHLDTIKATCASLIMVRTYDTIRIRGRERYSAAGTPLDEEIFSFFFSKYQGR